MSPREIEGSQVKTYASLQPQTTGLNVKVITCTPTWQEQLATLYAFACNGQLFRRHDWPVSTLTRQTFTLSTCTVKRVV